MEHLKLAHSKRLQLYVGWRGFASYPTYSNLRCQLISLEHTRFIRPLKVIALPYTVAEQLLATAI
ncbi:hypothetical protein [Pseudoalteromonas sp. T1lg23B]|uniref:hypothetical protein n=1 Tax=Pseudoalteromonas sp. T1lg23B TaxID=2077097 RepID=UPI001F1CAD1E|nr:hypothetical protein [Pseudoalteromonas sp. T1lg23B]